MDRQDTESAAGYDRRHEDGSGHAPEHTRQSDEHAAAQITPPPKLPAAKPRIALMLIGVVVLVLLVGGGLSMLTRIHDSHVLAEETQQDAVPTVAVVHPTPEKANEELVLPGTLQAYVESPIYARTNGYLLRWYKDIGSRVKQGDLLADIDTPEVDQELRQAQSCPRSRSLAAMNLAKINADRYVALRKTDSVSQEEADTQSSGYEQAMANLPPPMPTSSGWRSWKGSSTFTRRLRASSPAAPSIPERSSMPATAEARARRRCSASPSPIRCASTLTCRRPTRRRCRSEFPRPSPCRNFPASDSVPSLRAPPMPST